ncbi:hypothetical protein BMF31_10170 [Staphylococcus aureus]|nr:hypothetical protein BMF31_10170 [Staphylococcus aureus]ONH18828.1 hypothetical protein BMF23_10695 [Staphylococcus aureus]
MNKTITICNLRIKYYLSHIPIRVQNIQVVLISRYVTFDFKRKAKVFMFVLVLNYFVLDDTYF